MVVRVIQTARLLIILAGRHRSLVFENLALRQQLAVYRRTRPKPAVRWSERLFWVGLRLAWSSSSLSSIFAESFGPTSRTTSDLARTSRSARMLRWDAPSNRPAASWCDLKSAVCTTATNGKPPDRAWLHRARDRS